MWMWMKWLATAGKSGGRRSGAKWSSRTRLSIEGLERRLVPSTTLAPVLSAPVAAARTAAGTDTHGMIIYGAGIAQAGTATGGTPAASHGPPSLTAVAGWSPDGDIPVARLAKG
jgi:hypothetical protein